MLSSHKHCKSYTISSAFYSAILYVLKMFSILGCVLQSMSDISKTSEIFVSFIISKV